MSAFNEWSPDPAHRFLAEQNRIQGKIRKQAQKNPVIHEINFPKPARTETHGGYYEEPDTSLTSSSAAIIVDSPKKTKKKQKAESPTLGALIVWLFIILMMIGMFAG